MGSTPSTEAPVSEAEMAAASRLLLSASRRCNADVVKQALTARANPNVRSDHSGRPALSFAAQCADTTLPLQHLLAARANLDAAAEDGRTALHIAIAWERGPAATKLVEAGASKNIADKHGLTPLEPCFFSVKLEGDKGLAFSLNIFRYIGDYLHLGGIITLLVTIVRNKSVAGISRTTQILYCIVFITRYLDLFDHAQSFYLVFFKLTYIATSIFVLALFYNYDSTYARRHDTCNMTVILVPCSIAALLLTNDYSPLEVLWTFSEFIEGFAMVPQYIYCYRERVNKDVGTSLYVVMLGGYRINMPRYSDIQSWIGGIVEIMFFLDFLNYRFTGNSILRSFVLKVDTKINEISDQVESKVLGSASRTEKLESEGGEMRRRRKQEEERPMEDV
eukprot:symbB.v1.2.032798.t1/scaffold3984.1/size46886/1